MMARLGDYIFEYALRNKKDEGIPVYSVTNENGFCTGYFSKEVASQNKTNYKIVPRGYFAYNPSRINVGSVDWQHCEDRVIVSPLYVVFGVKKELLQGYLYHYLKSDIALNYIRTYAIGSVRDNLKFSILSEFPINLPPLAQQRQIAATLDHVDHLISLRKHQLEKLDQLVKSRFVEMFGDPVTNPMGWDTYTIESICDEIYGGGTPPKSHPEYYENGDIPWITSKDMKTDLLYTSKILINSNGVDNSTARIVPQGSVIVVIRSGILKHTLPVGINMVPVTVNQDLKAFIPSKRIKNRYFAILLKMLEKDILSGVRAVTADNIEFDSLKKREIIVPPIYEQENFDDFVAQTDKSKLVIQKSLAELETLKASLMQQYFC